VRDRAFTLVEMAVALFVLALLFVQVSPHLLKTLQGRTSEEEARALWLKLSEIRSRASQEGTPYRVLASEDGSLWYQRRVSPDEWGDARKIELPSRVRLSVSPDVVVFRPVGLSSGGRILLEGPGGRFLVRISPLGRVDYAPFAEE